MQSTIDCVHCYLKQAVSAMKHAGLADSDQYAYLYQLMDDIKQYDPHKSPAENSSLALLKLYQLLDNPDPYLAVKKESNDLALSFKEDLETMLAQQPDQLEFALKISVAGNVIDLGIHRQFNIEASIAHILENGFAVNHYSRFKKAVQQSDKIMILGDNTGEIVFDMLLVQVLNQMGKDVTYVVKEKPILNDATLSDARYVGMDHLAHIITTGSQFMGALFSQVSDQFKEQYRQFPLVIAKGQANFESLEAEPSAKGKVYFLLKLKCDEVACCVGKNLGDMVFLTPD